MSCNYYRGKCLFLNGKEDGCKGCPIKKAYNKGVRDTKKDYRQQGEWVYEYDDFYKCSICGRPICTEWDQLSLKKDFPFCHCGADMRGDVE